MKKRNIVTAVFGTAVLAGAGLYQKTSQFVDERLYRTHIKRTLFETSKPQTVRIKNMNDAILTGHLLEVDHADNTLIMVHGFTKDASSLENEAIYFQSICPHTNILMIDCYGNGSEVLVSKMLWILTIGIVSLFKSMAKIIRSSSMVKKQVRQPCFVQAVQVY